jgi:hypothetical protein
MRDPPELLLEAQRTLLAVLEAVSRGMPRKDAVGVTTRASGNDLEVLRLALELLAEHPTRPEELGFAEEARAVLQEARDEVQPD